MLLPNQLVLTLLFASCFAQVAHNGLDFTVTPSTIAMCGDSQTLQMEFECRLTRSYSNILALEVGVASGGSHSPIARILNDRIYAMDIIDRSYANRFNQTNYGNARLSARLLRPTPSDMHTYYCSVAYIYGSIIYHESYVTVQAKSLKGESPNCRADQVDQSLVHQHSLSHPNAGRCPDGKDERPEALVLSFCGVPDVTKWKPGQKVVDICCQIPPYTPIATFVFGVYVEDEHGVSAVFLGCTNTGFSMAIQLCGHPPMLVNLTRSRDHGFVEDADNYHVLMYENPSIIG